MPPLDSATINAVLQKQGMPNTTENLNRIAQFDAVAPGMLQQYLGQGTDNALAGTNAAIDNSIAQTDPRLAQLVGPNPLSSTLDPNTGRTNIGPGLVNTPPPPDPVRGGGGARPPNAGMRGVAPPTEPPPGSMPVPGSAGAQANAQPAVGSPSWEQMMISMLGPAAYAIIARARQQFSQNPAINRAPGTPDVPPVQQPQAAGRGAGAGGVNQPDTSRVPAPYSTDTRTPATNNPTRGSPAVPTADPDAVPRTGPPASGKTSTQTPADIERMRQETAAANAAPPGSMSPESAALTEQMKAQNRTRETLKRARETVGGRR